MPQFTTTTTIYDMVYLGTTGLTRGDLSYEFKKDGATKSITLSEFTELNDYWYSLSFVCDEQTDNLTLSLSYDTYYYSFKYVIGDSAYSESQSGNKIYYVVNLDVTGLVAGDVTMTIYQNKVEVSKAITFNEEQDNFYEIFYTPDADDFWFLTLDYKAYRILLSEYCNVAPTGGGGTTINVQASTTNQVSASSSNYTIVRASS